MSVLVALGASPTAASEPAGDVAARNAETVRAAFAAGVGGPDSFYRILADDVQWTVTRAAGASTYTSKHDFLEFGTRPVIDRLRGPIQAHIHQLLTAGSHVVARWRGTATARDGVPYVNEYNWVMTMSRDTVTHVMAYLDTAALDDLIHRVPLQR